VFKGLICSTSFAKAVYC